MINSVNQTGLHFVIMTLGALTDKYKGIQSGNKAVKVLENNDMAALVKILEDLNK